MTACGSNAPLQPSGPSMSFFVTSATSETGNLGGLAGADATCQRAGAGGRTGRRGWRAYLSVERDTTNDNRPDGRARSDRHGPWYNVDLTLVANNLAELHARRAMPRVFSTSAASDQRPVKVRRRRSSTTS